MRHRHRGVQQRPPLGAQARGDGPYRAADGAAVGQALRQDQQERCRRCGSEEMHRQVEELEAKIQAWQRQ